VSFSEKAKAMTSTERELIATLKRLFQSCKDGENGYRVCAKYIKADGLTELLDGYAQRRAQYAAELQSELGRLGGHSESTGTIAAALEQGWTRVKSAFTGGDDNALLAACEHGEEVARQQYEEALKQDLPADLRALFERHCEGVGEAERRIRALEPVAS
jgi:uncharacterized protein (TIGR02284 family)